MSNRRSFLKMASLLGASSFFGFKKSEIIEQPIEVKPSVPAPPLKDNAAAINQSSASYILDNANIISLYIENTSNSEQLFNLFSLNENVEGVVIKSLTKGVIYDDMIDYCQFKNRGFRGLYVESFNNNLSLVAPKLGLQIKNRYGQDYFRPLPFTIDPFQDNKRIAYVRSNFIIGNRTSLKITLPPNDIISIHLVR